MTPRILFIIASDPRVSARPAEAIRIAAGVGTWKKAHVEVCLWGPAVLCLSEYPDDLVDAENFEHYLPILGEWGWPVHVCQPGPLLNEIGQTPMPFEAIDADGLAALCAESNSVMRF